MIKIFSLLLVFTCISFAGSRTPIPAKLLEAKSACIENRASAAIADNAYDEFRKWGRFQLVESAEEADIIVVISADERAQSTQLKILDRKSGQLLWSDSRFWGRWKSAARGMIGDLRKRMESK